MSSHYSATLANGHTLTLVDAGPVRFDSLGPRRYWKVQERNELGTFLATVYTSKSKNEAEAWIARAQDRGIDLPGDADAKPAPTTPVDDPCDCGTVTGPNGGYVAHAPGAHKDCTGYVPGRCDFCGRDCGDVDRAPCGACGGYGDGESVPNPCCSQGDSGEHESTPAPWADLPQGTRDTYAARWAREAYAGDVPELVTDAQAFTLVALAEHCGESWQCSPSVNVERYGDGGSIVAVFSWYSPAPNPVVRLWAGGDAYSAMNESDYTPEWVGKLRADHGRVIVERQDDAAYVIAPGGTYEPAPARFGR